MVSSLLSPAPPSLNFSAPWLGEPLYCVVTEWPPCCLHQSARPLHCTWGVNLVALLVARPVSSPPDTESLVSLTAKQAGERLYKTQKPQTQTQPVDFTDPGSSCMFSPHDIAYLDISKHLPLPFKAPFTLLSFAPAHKFLPHSFFC